MSIKAINSNNETLISPKKIVNHFANELSKYSSDENFSQLFISFKYSFTASFNNPADTILFFMDQPITLPELNGCLKNVKGTAPGIDRITYQMIKPLHSIHQT